MSCPPLWVAGSSLHFQHLQDSCGFEPMMVEYLKIIQMWVHVHPLYATVVFPLIYWRSSLCKGKDPEPVAVVAPSEPRHFGLLGGWQELGMSLVWLRWIRQCDMSNLLTCTFDNEPVTPYYWDTWTLKTSKLEKQSKSGVLRETWVANDYCKLYPQSSLRKN